MSVKTLVVTGSEVAAGIGRPTLGKVTSELLNDENYSKVLSHDYGNYLPEFWRFANELAKEAHSVKPGAVHKAIADNKWDVITQNIGGIQRRAGSTNVIEVYGNIFKARCLRCHKEMEFPISQYEKLSTGTVPKCNHCGKERTRPDIVLPLEKMKHRKEAEKLLREANYVIYVGVTEDSGPVTDWYHKVPHSILISDKPWGNFNKFIEMSPNDWVERGAHL